MELFTSTSSWNDDEHRMFSDLVTRFFVKELVPNIDRFNAQQLVDQEFWQQAGEAGIMCGSVPMDYGGIDGGIGYDAITLYHQGAVGDTSWGYGIQSIVVHYIVRYGSEEQKQNWVPRLISGKSIGALAMTEPSCGSDVQSMRTTAIRDGNQYLINGSKMFITNGQSADLIILAAKRDKKLGAKGISLILVDANQAEGFRRGKTLNKLGLKGNDTAELYFDNVKVPLTNLLGEEEGQGFYQMMQQLPWERLLIGISALGLIDFALKVTVEYVQNRKAFGQRIMDFQNTRFKLAEIKTKAEILRSFINDCIERLEKNQLDPATASMAKYWGSQTQNEVMNECLQLHGGYGYMMEYPIARLYADSRVQMIYGGTNEIMKELIARSLDN